MIESDGRKSFVRRIADTFAAPPLEQALILYATHFPVQKGKWRFIEWYINSNSVQRHRKNYLKRIHRNGFVFELDLKNYVDQWIYLTGFFERADYLEVLEAVSQNPGSVVFDVGAQIGFYTLGLARTVGAIGSVHAFEPNPASFKRLRQHVSANGSKNVILNQVALGEAKVKKALLAPTCFNTGGATLLPIPLPDSWGLTSFEVQIMPLDEYCEQNRIQRLDFVKIDCEGYEPFVLQGAKNALRTWRPRLLVEFNPNFLTYAGWTAKSFLELLTRLNYKVFRLWRGKLVEAAPWAETGEVFNLHCLPE